MGILLIILAIIGIVLLIVYIAKPIHDKGQNIAVTHGSKFGPWGAAAGKTAKLMGYKGI